MTIQESYEIFYGKTKKQITEEYIEKNYTQEIIQKDYRKLTSKYHPDIHQKDNDKYNEKMTQINLAYEVLLKSYKLTSKRKNTSSKDIKSLIGDTDEDFETLIEVYEKLAYYTYQLRKYKIITGLYKNTDYYYREIKGLYLPSEIYESIKEYNKINVSAKRELEQVKTKYNILKQLLKSKKSNIEMLIKALENLAGEYYDFLDDEFLKIEVSQWYKYNSQEDENKYNDQLSYIKNIKNILKRILNNSKALNSSICQTVLNINSYNALEELSKSKNLIEKINILETYRQKRHQYTSQNIDWSNKITAYQNELENLKNRELDEDYFKSLEKELRDLIPEEYLSLLIEDKVISKMQGGKRPENNKEYDDNNSKLTKEYKRVIREIEEKINEIKKLFLSNNKNEPKFKDKYDSNNIVEFLTDSEKMAITLYYRIFICYYTNIHGSMISSEIEEIYQDMFNIEKPSDLDPEKIDMFYNILTYKYKSLKFNDFKLTPSIEEETRRKLILDIKEQIAYAKKINTILPDNLLQKTNNLDSLDLINIYKLLEEIQNTIYKKIPLK